MTLEEKLALIKEIQTGEFFIDEEEESNLILLKKD